MSEEDALDRLERVYEAKLADSKKREVKFQKSEHAYARAFIAEIRLNKSLQQENARLRDATVEECAAWIEQAEVLLPIEDFMGTKTDLTAKFALALAKKMRQDLARQALAAKEKERPTGICSAHRDGEDSSCRICYGLAAKEKP